MRPSQTQRTGSLCSCCSLSVQAVTTSDNKPSQRGCPSARPAFLLGFALITTLPSVWKPVFVLCSPLTLVGITPYYLFYLLFFFCLLDLQMSNFWSVAHTPIFVFVSSAFHIHVNHIWDALAGFDLIVFAVTLSSFCAGVSRHRASVVRWYSRVILFQNYRRWARGSQSQREPWEHIKAAGALWWSCGLLPETFGYNQSHLRQGGSRCFLCWQTATDFPPYFESESWVHH